MPLDPNVYSGIDNEAPLRLAQLFDPAVQRAKRVKQYQDEEAMTQIEDTRTLRNLLKTNPNAGLDTLAAKARETGNLGAASQFQNQFAAEQKAAMEARNTQLSMVKKQLDNVDPLLGQVFANPSNESIIATLGAAEQRGEIPPGTTQHFLSLPGDVNARRKLIAQHGLDPTHRKEAVTPKIQMVNGQGVDTNPETNPGIVGTVVPEQLSPGAVLSAETARRGQDMTNQRARETNALKAQEIGVTGGGKAFEAENKLRDEYQKGSGTFVKIRDAYGMVQAAAKDPSAAGDLSLIFAYMRTLDPNSVVREGEFATAQNAASIPDRVRNAYNKALSGERLNEGQRKDFINNAKKIYEQQTVSQNKLTSEYRKLAGTYGLREGNVVTDYSLPEATSQPKVLKYNPATGGFN